MVRIPVTITIDFEKKKEFMDFSYKQNESLSKLMEMAMEEYIQRGVLDGNHS